MSNDTRPPNIPPWERLGQFERTVVLAVSKMIEAVDGDDELADKVEELMVFEVDADTQDEEDAAWANEFNEIFDKVLRKACQSFYSGLNGDSDKLYYYAIKLAESEEDE